MNKERKQKKNKTIVDWEKKEKLEKMMVGI
jgi:hypothetical protein